MMAAFKRFRFLSSFVPEVEIVVEVVNAAVRTSGVGPLAPGRVVRIGRSVADMAGKSGNSGSENERRML